MAMATDDKTRTELEAAVFRRLVEHLRSRTDVQNIELMNLAGFCRNCLSNWLKEAADAEGVGMTKDESREAVYGMPYEQWKAQHQNEAMPEQRATFAKALPEHRRGDPKGVWAAGAAPFAIPPARLRSRRANLRPSGAAGRSSRAATGR